MLYGYFESSEPMVRIPAARALDQRGDPRALDRLIGEFSRALASDDDVVRKRGVTDLGRTRSPRALKSLEPLASDPSADVRLELARMLYFIRDSSSLQLSRRLMDDPSPAVRDEARKANEMLREFLG